MGKLDDQATAAYNRDDYAAAVRLYTQAIELCPASAVPAPLYVSRSSAHIGCGELEKALEDADHAVRLDPDDSDAHGNRGAVLLHMCHRGDDRFDEARAAYRRAIELYPSDELAKRTLEKLEQIASQWKLAEAAKAEAARQAAEAALRAAMEAADDASRPADERLTALKAALSEHVDAAKDSPVVKEVRALRDRLDKAARQGAGEEG